MEPDTHPSQPVAVEFISSICIIAAVRSDHNGALRAERRRFGNNAVTRWAPYDVCRERLKAVGVASLIGLGKRESKVIGSKAAYDVAQQFRDGTEQVGQSALGGCRQVVYPDARYPYDRERELRSNLPQRRARDAHASPRAQRPNRRTPAP